MTEAQQRRFYFPIWNGCAVANGWLMRRDRLQVDLDAQRQEYATWPDPARELYLQVVTAADQFALQAHRAVTATDLRHACNWVASNGRRTSSADLTNPETNRVAALLKLLADPDDLDAVMDWLNPDRAEHGSFVAFLRKRAHDGVLEAIAGNAFGTRRWEDLPIEKLRWIAKQVKHRRSPRSGRAYYRLQLSAIEQQPEYEPNPF